MRALDVRLSPSDYENMGWWFLEDVLLYLKVESQYHDKPADEGSNE